MPSPTVRTPSISRVAGAVPHIPLQRILSARAAFFSSVAAVLSVDASELFFSASSSDSVLVAANSSAVACSSDSIASDSVPTVSSTTFSTSCCSGNNSPAVSIVSSAAELFVVSSAAVVLIDAADAGILKSACVKIGLPNINTEELTRIRDTISCFFDLLIIFPSFYLSE